MTPSPQSKETREQLEDWKQRLMAAWRTEIHDDEGWAAEESEKLEAKFLRWLEPAPPQPQTDDAEEYEFNEDPDDAIGQPLDPELYRGGGIMGRRHGKPAPTETADAVQDERCQPIHRQFIERRGSKWRAECSCGTEGPMRRLHRQAENDADAHGAYVQSGMPHVDSPQRDLRRTQAALATAASQIVTLKRDRDNWHHVAIRVETAEAQLTEAIREREELREALRRIESGESTGKQCAYEWEHLRAIARVALTPIEPVEEKAEKCPTCGNRAEDRHPITTTSGGDEFVTTCKDSCHAGDAASQEGLTPRHGVNCAQVFYRGDHPCTCGLAELEEAREQLGQLAAIANSAWRVRTVLNLNIEQLVQGADATAQRNLADALNDLSETLPLSEDGYWWAALTPTEPAEEKG